MGPKYCYNYESGEYEWIEKNGYSWDQGEYVFNWDRSPYYHNYRFYDDDEDDDW